MIPTKAYVFVSSIFHLLSTFCVLYLLCYTTFVFCTFCVLYLLCSAPFVFVLVLFYVYLLFFVRFVFVLVLFYAYLLCFVRFVLQYIRFVFCTFCVHTFCVLYLLCCTFFVAVLFPCFRAVHWQTCTGSTRYML